MAVQIRESNCRHGDRRRQKKKKRAVLLHYSGLEVDEIFDTLENTGEDKDYKTVSIKCRLQTADCRLQTLLYSFRKASTLK